MVGFARTSSLRQLSSEAVSYVSICAGVARFSSNSEMSAPETKARSPAPLTTTTLTVGSLAKESTIRPRALHMSRETALCRAGLLKTIQPTAPSFRAIMRSVPTSIGSLLAPRSSDCLVATQASDVSLAVAQGSQDEVRVLSPLRRRAVHAAWRPAQRHGLS